MLMLSRQKLLISVTAMLLLLSIPCILWLVGWQWKMASHYSALDEFLFFITTTGTAMLPALLTCLVFIVVLVLIARQVSWKMIIFTAVMLLAGTQLIKTALKTFYQEPRPYMGYLVEHGVDERQFYQEKRSVRQSIVLQTVEDNATLPVYLKDHWAKETGYSFPSGHAAFAICWLMIVVLVLPMNRRRDWLIFSVVWIWTALMIISRIRFGMHYPLDVFMSTVFVPIVCLLYGKFTQCASFNVMFNYVMNGSIQRLFARKGK